MHLQLFHTTGVWQASGTGLSIILVHGTTKSAYVILKQAPIHHSKCLSVGGVCEHAATRWPWPLAESPAGASVEKDGRRKGKEATALKREQLLSYLCKFLAPNLVMEVLQSLSPLWRTLVVHILPLGET